MTAIQLVHLNGGWNMVKNYELNSDDLLKQQGNRLQAHKLRVWSVGSDLACRQGRPLPLGKA